MMRVAIPSVTLMLTGAEIIFASFLLGFIDLPGDKKGLQEILLPLLD
jgi:hypothetical protein